MPSPRPKTILPKDINDAPQTVPNSGTDITSTDTRLYAIYAANKTASAATLRVYTKQSPAKDIIPTVSIPAYSNMYWEWIEGITCPGGVSWVAGTGSAIDASVTGQYK